MVAWPLLNYFFFYLQVIFEGNTEIISWIVVHDGSTLAPEYALEHNMDLVLLRSSTGCIDTTVVKNSFIFISRYSVKISY